MINEKPWRWLFAFLVVEALIDLLFRLEEKDAIQRMVETLMQ